MNIALFSDLFQYRGKSGLGTSTMAGCTTGGVIGLRGEVTIATSLYIYIGTHLRYTV